MKNKLLILLFLLFILIRLPFLDQIFLLHDERDIVLSGWSIAQTGKDLFGHHFPLIFSNISPNNPLVAIYFSALWFFLLPIKSVFLARLPFVLISSLVVFMLFYFIYLITKNYKKAILTTLIFCFSPWIFHITRLALDIPLALIFLLGGIILYLKRRTFFAFVLFLLMSFTYQGSRLLLPFLLVYLEIFFLIDKKITAKFILNIFRNIFFVLIVIIAAIVLEPKISSNRLSEITFFNNIKNSQTVDFKRNSTIAPLIVSRFFDNKFTVAVDEVISNLTKGFDPNYLFKNGDFSPINGNAVTGQFLFVLIFFYFLGIMSLGKRSSKVDFYLLGLIPLGMIPAILSTNGLSFSIRGILSSVGYSYLFVLGIIFFLETLKFHKFKYILIGFLTFIFFVNLSYFLYGYYFRRPVTIGELFNESERQLSNFLINNGNNHYIVYHHSPQDALLSLVFLNSRNVDLIILQDNLRAKKFSLNNTTLLKCNSRINYLKQANTIVDEACLEKKIYDIYNDVGNKTIAKRIPYKNFSLKTAYFVIR